jgi:signal transduction histidine kinase
MGWVAEHREPVCIQDLHDEPWRTIYYPLDADLKMRSELAVPLIGASGRLEGVLNLESPTPGEFTEQDSHLLQSLATQAVIAIQEVRLLDALQEVAQMLLLESYEGVLKHLVGLACELLNAAASAVWTLDGDQLVLQSASAGHERGETLPLRGSLTGEAILTREAVTTNSIHRDSRFHRLDLAESQSWDRALIVPLLSSDDGEPIGAFSVYSTTADPGRFAQSIWDEKVLTCLAHYAALAVHNRKRRAALLAAQEQHAVAETFAIVGDVAANLLHHLNNKVGTIPVRVQGIQDKCRAGLEADPYLASNLVEIGRSASDAMAAVRENLSHLRPIRMAPVDLAKCVRTAIGAATIPSGVNVSTRGLDSLPTVMASQQSLSLVFSNLIENAAEAMQGSGDITISGVSSDEWVELSVSDSGPGIARPMHDRVFEFSVSRSGAGHPGKLGFGLWWVKTLMVRLGGSVSVQSDGENGATFRLLLPRVSDGW